MKQLFLTIITFLMPLLANANHVSTVDANYNLDDPEQEQTYKLTYMVDGEVYKTFDLAVGAEITPEPAPPAKEGYTFSGWSDIPATMPANDVTVTGTYNANTYKLTYMVDGVEYKSYDIAYGTPITAEAAPTKEGYTFSGWSDIPATMPASDVTVTGTFAVNTYKLTYMVDGVEYKSYDIAFGTPITAEAAPEAKEGYTFSGWQGLPATMPANDVTVTGTYNANTYKLTYMVDGVEYKSYDIAYGTSITAEAAPTKEGYTFSGWSDIPATMPAGDVTVTGTFAVNTYKLTYMVDGVEYRSYDVEYGTPITAEAEPEAKEGYTFSGWQGLPATMPAENVTVTGTYNANTYSLIYVVDGVEYKRYDVAYGSTITPEAAPTKEGYTFSGWSDIPATMPAGDVTVTGTFAVNTYKLTYMVDGVEYRSYDVEYGTPITAEAEPEAKEGYTFSGWQGLPATMPAENVTVTGTYNANTYSLIYVVDGVEYKRYDVAYGSTITPEEAPVKVGYTFSGWSDIPATMPAGDVTVTGTFAVNTYKLTYMLDGVEYKSYDYTFGAEIPVEPDPAVKEGYTFSGWQGLPATMPAENVTVTGTYNVNTYSLIYVVDGVEYKRYDVAYGSTITPEEAPTKVGYTFSGWSDIPATMPAGDVTVTGTFAVNTYKLTYMLDGVEYKSYDYTFGAEIPVEPDPAVKEGYTFSGWQGLPATMPAENVTVTGTYNVNTYSLIYVVDGVEYKRYDVAYGSTITPEEAPTKVGYTFSGWSDIPATMPASEVTVTGSFTINTYKLTYLLDGEEYRSYDIEYGVAITPEAAPEAKEGYKFSGWSEIPETMPAHNVEVTGTFTLINKFKLTYILDGVEYKTFELEAGESITPEPDPTNDEGRKFSGWQGLPESLTMPAEDLTVTGAFAYKLTYMLDGEVYKEDPEIYYGTEISLEADPEAREGYTFSGWQGFPETQTMPAHDVEVTGTFTLIQKYKLTYILDGVEYATEELEAGEPITPKAAPTKDGRKFSGWQGLPESLTMPAEDVTVTGAFAYKLTYKVDGEVYKEDSEIYYGTEITPEAEPTKKGYTFSGWSEIPATMPAHDVEVVGTFTINEDELKFTVDGICYAIGENHTVSVISKELSGALIERL